MDKNKDRFHNISSQLNQLKCSYTRVPAIDGTTMETNEDVKKILAPRSHLIGAIFKSIDTKERWVYDGSVSRSFPNLNFFGHYGTKGLTLSNIKAFYIASNLNYEWFCILEDDSEINLNIYKKIITFISQNNNKKYDIVLLDARHNGCGGTWQCYIIRELYLD